MWNALGIVGRRLFEALGREKAGQGVATKLVGQSGAEVQVKGHVNRTGEAVGYSMGANEGMAFVSISLGLSQLGGLLQKMAEAARAKEQAQGPEKIGEGQDEEGGLRFQEEGGRDRGAGKCNGKGVARHQKGSVRHAQTCDVRGCREGWGGASSPKQHSANDGHDVAVAAGDGDGEHGEHSGGAGQLREVDPASLGFLNETLQIVARVSFAAGSESFAKVPGMAAGDIARLLPVFDEGGDGDEDDGLGAV